MRKNFLLTVMTICLVITFSFSISSFRSNAKDDGSPASYKYYKSIIISNGDTLWSIAQEYMDEEHYDSTNDYINEVRKLNALGNEDIHYGEYLIVPYYTDEYIG